MVADASGGEWTSVLVQERQIVWRAVHIRHLLGYRLSDEEIIEALEEGRLNGQVTDVDWGAVQETEPAGLVLVVVEEERETSGGGVTTAERVIWTETEGRTSAAR